MKDFPPLPEKETIGDDIVEKMVYMVKDKYEYYISSEALKQLLESDWATLDCIWGAVQYSIGPVMKDFVDKITQKRQNAENQIAMSTPGSADHVSATISKNLCKLIINSCYGKTLQSDEKYNNSKIVKNQKQFMNAIEKQFLLDFNILAPAVDNNDQGLVELKLRKQNCEIRCPKYLGACWILYTIVYGQSIPRRSLRYIILILTAFI